VNDLLDELSELRVDTDNAIARDIEERDFVSFVREAERVLVDDMMYGFGAIRI